MSFGRSLSSFDFAMDRRVLLIGFQAHQIVVVTCAMESRPVIQAERYKDMTRRMHD